MTQRLARIMEQAYKMSYRTAQIRLVASHPEVYEPCDDSFLLVDALLSDQANLLHHQPRICLEVGCGSGYVITSLALILGKQEAGGVYYMATDLNPHAVRVTRETLNAHGLDADLVIADVASGLEKRLDKLVDVMVVNPPYVPTPDDEVGVGGIAASWAGGEDGRTVIDKILPVADKLLSDRGWLYMVTLAENNPSELCLQMRRKGYASRIVLRRSTDEENLSVIKFWRDPDILSEENESAGSNDYGTMIGSMLSQFPRLPFLTRGDSLKN